MKINAVTPTILIDLEKIVHNYLEVTRLANQGGVRITGVVKGVAGDRQVIQSLLAAGLEEIGDSRLENFKVINSNAKVRKVLLRLPGISYAAAVVQQVDCSLNVAPATLRILESQQKMHAVTLMVDLGDQREGVNVTDLPAIGEFCSELKYLRITGLGANFSCFAGVKPTEAKLRQLVALADYLCAEFALPIQDISGGNSSTLPLLYQGTLPKGINHLRIGEGILLGRETLTGKLLPKLWGDAFLVEAEVLQVSEKSGKEIETEIGRDAFGRIPNLPEVEAKYRLLLNLGHQDTPLMELNPIDPRITILGGSSDYLVLASEIPHHVGDLLQFAPNYWSLLSLMTSPYVHKVYRNGG